MNTQVAELLSKILEFLIDWHLPLFKYLNDGLEEKEVRTQFEINRLEPTCELIELYQWRNGTKVKKGTVLDEVQIIPGFHLLSLEDALSDYQAMKNDSRWNPHWFPVFANGGGDFYAVDLSQSNSVGAPVIGFVLGEPVQEIEYRNLEAMLRTFVECYEKGIVFRTKEGYLEMDDNVQAKIAKKYNPDVEFWQIAEN